jgi:hypothetical protein
MKETMIINLDLLLKLQANPEEIDKLSKRKLKKIVKYMICVKGVDIDSGLTCQGQAETLKRASKEEEFIEAKAREWHERFDEDDIPCLIYLING